MPHVAFVPFTGFRVRAREMRELGMAMPGLQARAGAISQLPALGVLTLAGLNPPSWSASYHEAGGSDLEALADQVIALRPNLVAVSALTASVEDAYRFSQLIRPAGLPVVLGGLHATACPEEASRHVDALADRAQADWVEDLYADRFIRRLGYDWFEWPDELLTEHTERLAAIFPRPRRGPELGRELDRATRWGYGSIEQRLEDEALSESKREALQALLRLSNEEKAEEEHDEESG